MLELLFDAATKLSWLDYVMVATTLVILIAGAVATWKSHHRKAEDVEWVEKEFYPPAAPIPPPQPRLLITVVRLRTGGGFEYAQRLESSVTGIASNEVLLNVQLLESQQLACFPEEERVL